MAHADTMSPRQALAKAIEICGSQTALAQKIDRKQQSVWFWLNEANSIPPKVAVAIERATDGQVTRVALCPEVFAELDHA